MAVRVVITGAMGRMGSALVRAVDASEDFELYGATEKHDHPDLAKDVGRLLLGKNLGIHLENDLRNVIVASDVIIDFTWPDASLSHLEAAVDKGKAIVIGSTGFDPEQMDRMTDLAPRTRALIAPNMGAGVNLLFALAGAAARVLGNEYDAEIVEAHHRNKIDAPSGTARELARRIAAEWDADAGEVSDYGRKGQTGEREYGRIGVHSVRGGDVVGEHTVVFAGPGERLELTHRASSRELFVRGALRAAHFLSKCTENGLYTMEDVLKLEKSLGGRR